MDSGDEKNDPQVENEDEKVEDILGNGQLLKEVIVPGDADSQRPQKGCKVTIKLTTRLQSDGQIVPSETFDRIEAFVGDYDVFHGVDLVFQLMHVNEVCKLVVNERFAYGSKGKEPDVPPNATLVSEVHLLDIEWIDSESQLSIQERINYGGQKKDRGNFWFSRSDFSSAIHCYRRAVEFLDASEEEMQLLHSNHQITDPDQESAHNEQKQLIRQLIQLRATAYNNLAAAQIKSQAFDQALKSVSSSLDLNPDNVKALFRKATILSQKGDLVEAIDCLKSALQLEPDSRRIQQEIASLAVKRKAEIVKEKTMYRRMLQVNSCPEEDQNRSHGSKWFPDPIRKLLLNRPVGLFMAAFSVVLGIVIFYTQSN